MEMQKTALFWGKQLLPALRCREGGSARWEQQPRGKLVSFTESPAPAGRFGDQKPPGNCVMQPPQLRCWNGSSACSRLQFGVPPPRSLTALGTQTEVSVTAGAGTGAATKGLGRWHSSGTGQLLMWVSSCLPAARPTAPLDVLCHLQTQRQARIQLGPRPPGRAGLSSCSTAGAQERRHSGVGKEGGLDKDNARLHQAGAPTALAASPCQWRGLGSLCMGPLRPSSSLNLNPFNVLSMP